MPKINSRQKGAAGEREAAHAIADTFNVEARRGQQFSGSPDSPDIKTSIPGIHFEVKRVENLNVVKAMEQAIRDAGSDAPVLMHRKNRTPWLLTVRLSDAVAVSRIIAAVSAPKAEAELEF